MDKTLYGIAATFGGALLFVGLTFSRSIDAPADFRFVNGTEPKTLDPQLMTGQPEGRIAEAIFEGLTRHDAKTLAPAPGAARSWDVSSDGKRYVFHLRDDARWTDGHPVTAHDFVYSWKRLLDPKLASEYAYIVFPIRYAEALSTFDGFADALASTGPALATLRSDHPTGLESVEWQRFVTKTHLNDPLRHETSPWLLDLLARRDGRVTGEEIQRVSDATRDVARRLRREAEEARTHFGVDGGAFATDDHTLVVELRAPTPYFLQITSFYPTLPTPRWVADDPRHRDDWFLPENIVSNGPFRLKRWIVNDHIRLERNETYWGKRDVRLGAVDALSIESETTALNLYLTGEVDWLPESYPKDLTEELKKRSDFRTTPGLIVYFYRFNVRKPPFDDVRVRKAINLAVDRKTIVEQVLGLGQVAATTFVPPGMAGYESPKSTVTFDVDRAKRLLSEAGYPEGKGFPEVGILYNTNQGHKKVAEVVADQLRRNLGIPVNAYNQEWQSFLDTVRSGDYSMARAGWIGDYADPNTFLDMWITNGGNNQTGWSSPVYDRLIAAAADVGSFADAPEPLTSWLPHPEDVRAALEPVRGAADPAKRLDALAHLRLVLLREAESILVSDALPILPLYFYVMGNMVSPRVHGLYTTLVFDDGTTQPNLEDIHPLRDIWVEGARGGRR
jgi:oligopeptide transport system substrate-binding protein